MTKPRTVGRAFSLRLPIVDEGRFLFSAEEAGKKPNAYARDLILKYMDIDDEMIAVMEIAREAIRANLVNDTILAEIDLSEDEFIRIYKVLDAYLNSEVEKNDG